MSHRAAAIRGLVLTTLCVALTGTPAQAVEPTDALLGASSDEHLWFVAEAGDGDGAVVLFHHARAMDGPYVEPLMTLPRRPEAMAAWADELFLVFASKPAGSGQPRETYRLRVLREPVPNRYFTDPPDRLQILASLSGEGKLAGFAGSPPGPVALLIPPQHADAGVKASPEAAAAEPVLEAPSLMGWTGDRWSSIDLPADAELTGPCRLAVGGAAGELLFILSGSDSTDPGRSVLHVRGPEATWRSSHVPVAAGRVRSLTRVDAQVLAVLAGPRDERCDLVYVRSNLVLPLAKFARPARAWSVLGMRDGPRIVVVRHADDATIRSVDPITGRLGEAQKLTPPPADAMSVLRMPLLLAITTFVLAMVIRYRPGARPPVSLPRDLLPLPAALRLVAAAIDLVPGAVVAMLVLRCRPADLFGLPLMAMTFEASVPYIVMVTIAILHGAPSELIWRRTVGKALVGARLWGEDGHPPEAGRIVLRNLVKYLILLVPPLAVLALMDPNLQGLNDLVGRTVVVRRRAETEDRPNDR
jgi:uncharacterized RDD family membrane protein YckC